MRVIGIDPGTVTVDLCGLQDGELFLDRSLPTSEALAPGVLRDMLMAAGPLDLIAGPSGYGLPLTSARDLTDVDVRLAVLAPGGEEGGIGGLGAVMRSLAVSGLAVVFTPGVIHLASVPPHRKVNRVDMGTAEKVCAAALAIHERAAAAESAIRDVSFIQLELGGAFTAAVAVERGCIVDGMGGTSGPMGARAAGALDGEVAYLAGRVSKAMLFRGGMADIPGERLATDAYLESAVKAVAMLAVSAPGAREVILSGRMARHASLIGELRTRLAAAGHAAVHTITGFAAAAGEAAQGAALIADGLAGGASAALVDALGIRHASGTVLDHLRVIAPAAARAQLGIA
jgi:predicted butyrate kinase (DUF1464 family)